MKIVMICDFYHEDFQYQENLLTKYYIKDGHDVTIIASTFISIFDYYSNNYNKKKGSKHYLINGYEIFRQKYSLNIVNKIRKLRNLKQILNKKSPDLIYVHGTQLNLVDAVNYKKHNPKCKLIYDFHGDFSNSANNWLSLNILHKIIFRLVLEFYYRRIDKIFYITPDGGVFLNQVYKLPYNKMALLPLGVDLDYIRSVKESIVNIKIRHLLGINQNDFVIFTGGKITREKQTDLVIKSFLTIKMKSVHLIIVGDTKDENYKSEILALINSHPRIHFIGWVHGNEVYDYMSACDLAIFPSSQSVLWQQSIGMGLPLIIGQTESQDASYLNRNNNIIILEKEFVTKENICDKIESLLINKSLLSEMKNNAIITANDFLSYERILSITLE
jgi:1,2-diacylglycerol 3-alpha-glucosyltransferase